MLKPIISPLFWTSTLGGIIILFISMGWLMVFFGLALVPMIVLHIVAGAKALRQGPRLHAWIAATSVLYILFTLVRLDSDDVNTYTGFSSLLNFLDSKSSKYISGDSFYLYLSILLFLVLVVLDILLIRKSKLPPAVPVNHDFV